MFLLNSGSKTEKSQIIISVPEFTAGEFGCISMKTVATNYDECAGKKLNRRRAVFTS